MKLVSILWSFKQHQESFLLSYKNETENKGKVTSSLTRNSILKKSVEGEPNQFQVGTNVAKLS